MKISNIVGSLTFALNFAASTLVLAAMAVPVSAQQVPCVARKCHSHLRGRVANNSEKVSLTVGENTEKEAANDVPLGYAISVDGEVVAGSEKFADQQRSTDVALESVDVQVKFDGLDVKPILNISTFPARKNFRSGENVDFFASLNYGSWVSRGEVRIYEFGKQLKGKPFAVVPINHNGGAQWNMPKSGLREFEYVLRVYDQKERYDETRPLILSRDDKSVDLQPMRSVAEAPGFSEDGTAFRNIPVYGGAVTVFGSNVESQKVVIVMGEQVPVDADGKFVVQKILPPGDHHVTVKIGDHQAKGLEFQRDLNIPTSEWFYVALADLTVGKHFGTQNVQSIVPGEFDDVYTKGRLAFYLKGRMKGQTLLTVAADTGEGNLQDLFNGLDAKDPRQFLRRIDPNKYYPVYGDDSTTVEDAPTRGKFYVRLERGDSHVMWGNFKTRVTGTKFLRSERALYGANAVYVAEDVLPTGERRSESALYAALPGTLPQRDVMRGTGGSAYFLKHQDVSLGTETVNVAISDPVTNLVINRRALQFGTDYEIDYVQGVILLRQPLQSTAPNSVAFHSGALNGNLVNLEVSYEYTPSTADVNGYALGGRGQHWFGNHVRLGLTASREKTGGADQKLFGADVRLQKSQNTYVEAEVAQTRGPGFGQSTSSDGGTTIASLGTSGVAGRTAFGYRVDGHADLAELMEGSVKGNLEAHYEHKEAGFSTLDEQVVSTKEDLVLAGSFDLSEKVALAGDYKSSLSRGVGFERAIDVSAGIKVHNNLTIAPGVHYSDKSAASAIATDIGTRTDLGVKITYDQNNGNSAYLFGQLTAGRTGFRKRNNSFGIGGETALSDAVKASGEVSYGSNGIGGLARLAYNPTADDTYYIGYRLDPERKLTSPETQTSADLGAVIAGAKHRYSERLAIFSEDSYDLFGLRRTLAQTYGVNYTPDARWSIGGNIELGTIRDSSINPATLTKYSDFDRKAIALSADFKGDEGNAARMKAEMRFEDSEDNSRNMDSYLFSSTISRRMNDDWRFLGSLDAVFSDATASTRNSEYVEATLGYAYRPANNDRWNTLFKYNFLFDLPGIDQVTANGTTNGPAQRSHILSIDANYDVSKVLTIGGKYGFRSGETKPRNGSAGWTYNAAQLAVLRADLNVAHNWDALLEGRMLWSSTQSTKDYGVLVAGYRHFGENFKIGLGYNFGGFTDDLRDQTFDHSGVFINAIGQF
jgi:hypothetical protein